MVEKLENTVKSRGRERCQILTTQRQALLIFWYIHTLAERM